MGLLSFVKNAGRKLMGRDDEKEIERQAEAEKLAAEAREKLRRARQAANLRRHVESLGLEVEDAKIEVEGDRVVLGGKVASQELREKVVLAVGNHDGVATVDDRLEVTRAEPEATYYTVVRGDTLSKIAKQHYGNANKYPVIFEANRPMLEHPDKIYPGQVLRIPPIEG